MKDFIGIFDSGIGGLSVYETIKNTLPNENLIYLADELNCPYGTKSKEEVKNITLKNIEYLKNLGAKIIVIACNTATLSIIDLIEQKQDNLIGVIKPTAYDALEKNCGKIGLLATNLTVDTKIYDKYLGDYLVASEGCSDLVLRIENNDFDSEETRRLISSHLDKVKMADTIILGCTHFKFIKKTIQELLKNTIIIDSSIPTTKEVIRLLKTKNDLSICKEMGHTIYFTTGEVSKAIKQLENLKFTFDEIEHVNI